MVERLNKADTAAGLTIEKIKGRVVAAYDPSVMLKVVEKVAEGRLLRDVLQEPGMPSWSTVHRWMVSQPEARQAMRAAREISAMAFEEEAVSTGRHIAQEPGNSQNVRAAAVLLDQLRWSAARRNPKMFGDQKQTAIVVPVQINTSLNLGTETTGAGTEDFPNIYEVEAKPIEDATDAEFTELPDETPLVPSPRERMSLARQGPRKTVLTPRVAPDPAEAAAREVLAAKRRAAGAVGRAAQRALNDGLRSEHGGDHADAHEPEENGSGTEPVSTDEPRSDGHARSEPDAPSDGAGGNTNSAGSTDEPGSNDGPHDRDTAEPGDPAHHSERTEPASTAGGARASAGHAHAVPRPSTRRRGCTADGGVRSTGGEQHDAGAVAARTGSDQPAGAGEQVPTPADRDR